MHNHRPFLDNYVIKAQKINDTLKILCCQKWLLCCRAGQTTHTGRLWLVVHSQLAKQITEGKHCCRAHTTVLPQTQPLTCWWH